MIRPPPSPALFPYTTLFRSVTSTRFPSRPVSTGGEAYATSRSRTRARSRSTSQGSRVYSGPSGSVRSRRRSEEHTSELQSHSDLVCRLLLEKKKKKNIENQE